MAAMTNTLSPDSDRPRRATEAAADVFGWLLAVFAVAFTIRVVLILAGRSYLQTTKFEVERIAWSLATTGSFADAYADGSGPSAHAAPLYPLMLALIYRALGKDWAGTMAQEVLSSCLASLHYAMLPILARVCGMPVLAGVFGGLLGAVLPVNWWIQGKGAFEYSLSALWMVIFAILVISIWNDRAFGWSNALRLGVLTGVMMLTAPHVGPMFAGIALTGFALFRRSVPPRQLLLFLAIQAAVAAAMLVPWAVRNMLILGAPVISRSNVGMELALSNNDDASPIWDENRAAGLFHRMHPSASVTDVSRVREVGEVRYNREKMKLATAWIRSNPGRFAELTIRRVGLFWFPSATRPWQTAVLAAVTFAGLVGFARFVPGRTPAAWFFAATWLSYPISSYGFQMSARPRYPIEWSLFLFAGFLAVIVWQRTLPRNAPGTLGPISVR